MQEHMQDEGASKIRKTRTMTPIDKAASDLKRTTKEVNALAAKVDRLSAAMGEAESQLAIARQHKANAKAAFDALSA